LTATSNGTVRLWDLTTGRLLDSFSPEPDVLFVGSLPGNRILVGTFSGKITIWNAEPALPKMYGADEIYTVAFSPDSRRLASGGNDSQLLLWDPASLTRIASLNIGLDVGESIGNLAFVTDSTILVNSDHEVAIWDLSGVKRKTVLARSAERLLAVLSPDKGAVAIFDTSNSALQIVDTNNGHVLLRQVVPMSLYALCFSPDGQTIAASGSGDEGLAFGRGHSVIRLRGRTRSSHAVTFSPDGKYLLVGYDAIGDIYVWDWKAQRLVTVLHGHRDSVKSLSFSPDGIRFVSAADDGTLLIWDRLTFQLILTDEESQLSVGTTAFSPDGRFFAAAGDDGLIRTWNVSPQ